MQEISQKQSTPFYQRSHTAWLLLTVNDRDAYGMYAYNGIQFDHESPWRGTRS